MAGKIFFEAPNFLVDSITDWRWDRLDFIFDTGEYNDYQKIFTEYLVDNELYLQAMESESGISDALSLLGNVQTTNKILKTGYEWCEVFIEKDSFNTQRLHDLWYYADSSYDMKQIIDAANMGEFSFMDALKVVEYGGVYFNQVQDHREMLDAVYCLDKTITDNIAERRAAHQIYNLYGEDIVRGLVNGYWDVVFNELIEKGMETTKLYELTAKSTRIIMAAVFPNNIIENAESISLLSMYESVMYSASESYMEYRDDLNTDKNVDNMRQSLIMFLLASRSCYEVMCNAAKGYQSSVIASDYSESISYYENQISRINAMLCLLYKVADNVRFDSYEHIEEYENKIKNQLKESNILNTLKDYDFLCTEEKSDVEFEVRNEFNKFLNGEICAYYSTDYSREYIKYHISDLLKNYYNTTVKLAYCYIYPRDCERPIILIEADHKYERFGYTFVYQAGKLYINDIFSTFTMNNSSEIYSNGIVKIYYGNVSDSVKHGTYAIDKDGRLQMINSYVPAGTFDFGLISMDEFRSENSIEIFHNVEQELYSVYGSKLFEGGLCITEYYFDKPYYTYTIERNDNICLEYIDLCLKKGINFVSEEEIVKIYNAFMDSLGYGEEIYPTWIHVE